ncbi:hypothetical protein PENARI_c019G07134 [Penicillium arizonense]|uniref:Uncharacterized protein n=1 Tax=Penicillium arizonense TaxID=1835702 RepID=A0A1F5L9N4_PENAI|nr:hypothetical protein PENARI_c019G07134 [Penicillium arizonense]OGE49915.1 hypothetical protein PENARI_c019G07134 [Penicillium arizonense]
MSPVLLQDEPDSDEDVEFEDVPILHQTSTQNSERTRNGDISIDLPPVPTQQWNPPLYLPPQRTTPIPSGSEEEIQLRGRFSTGIEKITYRKMKSDMGMDAPDTPVSLRRYEGFKDLVVDVDSLVDMLWVSATPAIQTETLITLAGLIQTSLKSFPFDPQPTLTILHKLDSIFAALCTGTHPLTGAALPGAQIGQSLATETQKVRIRSLAEMTRYEVFSALGASNQEVTGDGDDDYDDDVEDDDEPWMLEATQVYEKSLMLLAEQDPGVAGDDGDVGCGL